MKRALLALLIGFLPALAHATITSPAFAGRVTVASTQPVDVTEYGVSVTFIDEIMTHDGPEENTLQAVIVPIDAQGNFAVPTFSMADASGTLAVSAQIVDTRVVDWRNNLQASRVEYPTSNLATLPNDFKEIRLVDAFKESHLRIEWGNMTLAKYIQQIEMQNPQVFRLVQAAQKRGEKVKWELSVGTIIHYGFSGATDGRISAEFADKDFANASAIDFKMERVLNAVIPNALLNQHEQTFDSFKVGLMLTIPVDVPGAPLGFADLGTVKAQSLEQNQNIAIQLDQPDRVRIDLK